MELVQLLKRELKIIYHRFADVFNIFIFFIIICFAFSFAASGNISLPVASSVIIICFMLSSNLSAHLIFEKDIETGMLQQLFLRIKSLNNLIFAKMIAHFICFGIPLTIAVPVASLFFNVAPENIISLVGMILITSLIISVINVMMAGITAGIKAGGMISIILSLPLYIPIMILNIAYMVSIAGGEQGIDFPSFVQNISAFLLIIIPLALFSVRQTIRNAVES